jgi:lactate racemase
MEVNLAYGRTGLTVNVPDNADVIRSHFVPGIVDEPAAIKSALRNPIQSPALKDLVHAGQKVVVTHSDITRPTPNYRLLPPLLEELEEAGIVRNDITLINALGTHRFQTETELRTLLGDGIVDNYRCLQHNTFDDSSLVSLGTTSFGHPVRLNRLLIDADIRILTGFIEPHFFAGFSGGPKAILPALAGFESVQTNHGYDMISHPKATWGVTEGNPIWEEMREMALRAGPSFLLNVSLNAQRQMTGIYAGDLLAAHAAGCSFVRQHAMVKVSAPYDVIVTTNNGYPLDQNLYQAIKGISAAYQVLRKGGAILLAAACEEGLPDYGGYAKLLAEAGSPDRVLELLAQPGYSAHDQWNAQVQAMIQKNADVYVYSDGLSDGQIKRALFTPRRDFNQAVTDLVKTYGERVCVLPEGPQTVAYL